MIAYQLLYNSGPSYSDISLYASKKGAYEAMRKHKMQVYLHWFNIRNMEGKSQIDNRWNYSQDWYIRPIEVLP